MQQATAIVGVLIGFLILTQIGIFVCDAMIEASSVNNTSQLYEAQTEAIDTFVQCLSIVRVLLIVAIVAVVFQYLQGAGLVPGFGGRQGGY
ncbi:MAG TPA: hypothetical protein PK336_01105 [Methanoculleus sp.]|nr:hypothetical protein [Methanoculleus sp.]HQP71068.1 hypothetical protein [Methanoculleus sp.]